MSMHNTAPPHPQTTSQPTNNLPLNNLPMNNLPMKRSCLCPTCSDQHWATRGFFWSALIRIRIPPSPAILAGNQLSNGPTQHYSVLISTDQQAQDGQHSIWHHQQAKHSSSSTTTTTDHDAQPPTPSHERHITMVTCGQHHPEHPEDATPYQQQCANAMSPNKRAQAKLTQGDDVVHCHHLAVFSHRWVNSCHLQFNSPLTLTARFPGAMSLLAMWQMNWQWQWLTNQGMPTYQHPRPQMNTSDKDANHPQTTHHHHPQWQWPPLNHDHPPPTPTNGNHNACTCTSTSNKQRWAPTSTMNKWQPAPTSTINQREPAPC